MSAQLSVGANQFRKCGTCHQVATGSARLMLPPVGVGKGQLDEGRSPLLTPVYRLFPKEMLRVNSTRAVCFI